MFVIVVGGGRIGFYLTKELLAEGHEIVLMEKDPAAAERIRDELGAVVVEPRRLRGHAPRRGRRQPRRHRGRRDRRRRRQPRRLPDGQASLRRAAHHRARQQPAQRGPLPQPRRGRDHQPHAHGPGRHRAGHPGPRAAAPGQPRGRRAGAAGGADRRGLARPWAGGRRTSRCPTAARSSWSSATTGRSPSGPRRSSRRATRSSPSRAPSARTTCACSSSATCPRSSRVRPGRSRRACAAGRPGEARRPLAARSVDRGIGASAAPVERVSSVERPRPLAAPTVTCDAGCLPLVAIRGTLTHPGQLAGSLRVESMTDDMTRAVIQDLTMVLSRF